VILLRIPERRTAADVLAVGLIGSELQLHEVSSAALPVSAAEACAQYVSAEEPSAEAGALHTVTLPGAVPATVLIVGLGDAGPEDLRIAAVALGRRIHRLPEACAWPSTPPAPSRAGRWPRGWCSAATSSAERPENRIHCTRST
jgi:hypothetical protein